MSKNYNVNHLIHDVCNYSISDHIEQAKEFIEMNSIDKEDVSIIFTTMDDFNPAQLHEFLDKLVLKYPNSKNHIFYKANRLLAHFNLL